MSAQHTPGKWIPVADCQFGTESTKIMCGTAIVAVCYGSNHTNDARLIASAPDLLEALKALRNAGSMLGGELGVKVDAAIAKAGGFE